MAHVAWPAAAFLIALLAFILIMFPTPHARRLMERVKKLKIFTHELALEEPVPPTPTTDATAEAAQPAASEPPPVPDTSQAIVDRTERPALHQVFALYSEGQCDEADRRLEQLAETIDPIGRAVLRGWGRALCGRADATDILQKASSDYPNDPRPFRFLGDVYRWSGDHKQASAQYMRAAAVAGEGGASDVVNAATALKSAGLQDDAIRILLNAIVEFPHSAALCKALGLAYKEAGNNLASIAFLERAVELSPTDAALRFDVAYNESDLGWHLLSFFNYSHVSQADDPLTINNLGVDYGRLGLPIAAALQYDKARSLGNTLAASHSAILLLDAGFAREAEQICTQAASEHPEDVNPRVFTVLSDISRTREAERTKMDDLNARVMKIRPYLARFAQPMPETAAKALIGHWTAGTQAELTVTCETSQIGILTDIAAKSYRTLTGNTRGSAMSFRWVRRRTALNMWTDEGVGFGYVENDKLRLLFLKDHEVEEMILTRAEPLGQV